MTVRTPHHSRSEMNRPDMHRETGDEKFLATTSPATLHRNSILLGFQINVVLSEQVRNDSASREVLKDLTAGIPLAFSSSKGWITIRSVFLFDMMATGGIRTSC